MPLIIISGYPSSGKTTRSKQLISDFTSRILAAQANQDSTPKKPRRSLQIQHIDDETLGLSREVYGSVRAEKDARAAFASAIRRAMNPDTIVVADGMNYIKGFRYQLYCDAKAVPTPSCVLQMGVSKERCRAWQTALLQQEREHGEGSGSGSGSGKGGVYDPETFENLLYRYEEPNGMSRWDAPLFVVAEEDALPPCEAIWQAVVGGGENGAAPAVKPNAATVLKPAAEQDYLYELDRTTADVVAALTAWQRDHPGEGGGEVRVVPETTGEGGVVVLPASSPPSLAQLQRLRRQFTALNRQHALNKSRIRELFVAYLNDTFQS